MCDLGTLIPPALSRLSFAKTTYCQEDGIVVLSDQLFPKEGTMNCKMLGCDGVLDQSKRLGLHVGCHSIAEFFPCSKCNRVHHADGDLAFNRQGHAPYLEDGHVVNKNADGGTESVL